MKTYFAGVSVYLEGNRDKLCFCSFSCINTGNVDTNTEIPLKGVLLLILQADAGKCPPQSRTRLLPVKLDTNFYHLIGILLLKKTTALVPTTAFLVLLHLHLLVDFVKKQDRSRGLGLRNSESSQNCLLMHQNLDGQLSARSPQNSGPAFSCVWGMQEVPAVAGELPWSITHTLTCTLPRCSPCM